jgi:phage shock protein PspC (stress-responsive transcriptional regulator)
MALERSRNDRVIAGVCGGIAKSLGWNSTAVRSRDRLDRVCSVQVSSFAVLALAMPEWSRRPSR